MIETPEQKKRRLQREADDRRQRSSDEDESNILRTAAFGLMTMPDSTPAASPDPAPTFEPGGSEAGFGGGGSSGDV